MESATYLTANFLFTVFVRYLFVAVVEKDYDKQSETTIQIL